MRRALAAVLAMLFLVSAGWTFANEALVEDWLLGQGPDQSNNSPALVTLQNEERWLVVVVDFDAHPAENGWGPDEAENLIEQAVAPYIDQLSGREGTLVHDVHPKVVRASMNLEDYGQDAGGKDTAGDGAFLPAALAEEVVLSVKDDVNWSVYDLNEDGGIDRFLVLHTTKGQEESPSITNRIWSHYTQFNNPIALPGGLSIEHYTMASLQTGSSGVGTIIHEMLHQMGAVDLYPVHDDVNHQSWKGPGDWDIMASGNWNGGGRWPAMPTGANLELVRPERIKTLELEWPPTAERPCIGQSIALDGVTEGGDVLKISIAEHESVFIEYRSDSGYDSRLPGHGLLVSYQDRSVGDFERNEVNTNPNQPWLKVIEADEGDDLVKGSNQGEASDLFLNNSKFGAEGVKIRTHDGLLVPWVATVSGEAEPTVSFTAEHCNPSFSLDLPDHGSVLLPNESIDLAISGEEGVCTGNLVASDGRGVSVVNEADRYRIVFDREATPNSMLYIEGNISCGLDTVDVRYPVQILNRVPVSTVYKATIHPERNTVLEVPIESLGDNKQRVSIAFDGPLERVAAGQGFVELDDDTSYILTIEPSDLLSENMWVYGTIVLSTDTGQSWQISVELHATTNSNSVLETWTAPGRVIGIIFCILFLSSASAVFSAPSLKNKTREVLQESEGKSEPEALDAWGRPVDGVSSADARLMFKNEKSSSLSKAQSHRLLTPSARRTAKQTSSQFVGASFIG